MDDGCVIACRIERPCDAPAVIFSGSMGCALPMWDEQAGALADRMRVIRYDPRGHGASDAPLGAYGLDRLARDALQVLDALGVEQAAFCGLSMGGMVGQRLGVVAPDRLSRLVLACTSAYMGPPDGWRARIADVSEGGMAAIVGGVLDRWFTPAFRTREPVAVERVRAMLLATPPAGYAGCCAALRDMDQRATAHLISAPTLVIAGSHDPATPPEHGRFLAERIAGARYLELDAAHLANIEQPQAFSKALRTFLG